jgi:DNA repair protein RecN (Recombination protein N)
LVFAQKLERLLGELAMDRTRFEVRFSADPLPETGWGPTGIDSAEFFVSTNPGEDLRPLSRVVSGGELSRMMLAIKTLTATTRHGFADAPDRPPSSAAPGLIFDEVDAGIGGRVADVVGRNLRSLGSAFQVLCITHLPQIAVYADTHFEIQKTVDNGRTRTTVHRLDGPGRVEELARMLGGSGVTDAIRASAEEMLAGRGAKGVAKAKGESESARKPRRAGGLKPGA